MRSDEDLMIDAKIARSFAKYMKRYQKMYSKLAEIVIKYLPEKTLTGYLIVDIGTGPGFLPEELYKLSPNIKIIGLDSSKEMLELFEKNDSDRKFEKLLSSAEKIPLKDASVDIVVSRFSLCYWDKPEDVFSEINRILKTNGKIILETLNKDFPKWKLMLVKLHMFLNFAGKEVIRYHINSYEKAYLQDEVEKMIISNGFDIVKIKEKRKSWKTLFIAQKSELDFT